MHSTSLPLTVRTEQIATRAVFLVAGTAMAAWAPLVPFAKARLGVGDGQFGLLLLGLGLGSLLAMPLTGVLTSRFGCRAVITLATIIVALTVPFLALADSVAALAITLIIFGASVGAVDVTMNIQALMVEKDSGRKMMSGFHGLFSVGGLVGAGGVSLLLGAGTQPLHATLAISALLGLLLIFAFRGLLPYANRDQGATPLFVAPRGIVIFIGILCFLVFLAEGAILDWSALFLIAAHSVDPAQAGFGYAMFAIAMTIGRLTGDRIVKRLGGLKIVVGGSMLAALGFALTIFAPVQGLAFAGYLLVGFGASNVVPVLFTAAGNQRHMPANLAIASITTIGYAGILAGPAAIGFIAEHSSLSVAFGLVAVGMVFIAISWPLAQRR